MHTSSWPVLAGGFGAALPASSWPVGSLASCGATILTFFAGGFDSDYHDLVAVKISTLLTDDAYLGRILIMLGPVRRRYRVDRPGTR